MAAQAVWADAVRLLLAVRRAARTEMVLRVLLGWLQRNRFKGEVELGLANTSVWAVSVVGLQARVQGVFGRTAG